MKGIDVTSSEKQQYHSHHTAYEHADTRDGLFHTFILWGRMALLRNLHKQDESITSIHISQETIKVKPYKEGWVECCVNIEFFISKNVVPEGEYTVYSIDNKDLFYPKKQDQCTPSTTDTL